MSGNTPRSALVTGGSRGIGRATALRLAANGHRVAVNYNTHPDEAEAVVEEIRSAGGIATAVGGNVAVKEEAVAMIDQAVEAHGPIEILINNAGVINDSLLMRMKDEQFEYTMNVNMFGTYYCTHKVIPGMVKGRWGRIINVSSVVGMRGNIGQSNYSASKAAVHGFTQSIAKEVATRGITANVVAPGYITTATSADISDKQRDTVLTWIPQGRFGEPDEVAPTIVFLTTDEAQYITGDIIRVDGGMAI
ncbi:3-oxoacyl-ACP reductase family protein [Candidatus Lucifugimonas marina]|uniref:SDR family oxidoreductase n=1 Tax=Candidatus Lucifugimonas marina TaxID=3038979 RepID=A0AAJ5ZFI6_9CHLR|nr:SDR family oxidoreductase [SAR202 cluster bacterium JH702]MDG0870312.1 SDR family oxidoreductase [SAR202 cluster bacterium JH639]WFG36130.1 SDR family oxidoreductase [SAR202 cluster bacterium JH545]WFG40075.1 SDR family oxidoreductase [SAR202 cluster bacterium JH1073]